MRRSLLLAVTAVALWASLPSAEVQASGLLLPTDAAIEPLMIRYHRVSVDVRERAAETRVEQTFRNHTSQVLEATYVFPVPEGATVSGFAMWVDGRRQEGELLDAGEARAIYQNIVARVQDPGLVEHIGGRLFRARVFPIPANGEQRIEVRFTQALEYEAGVIHYRYPLSTGRRAARTLEDLTISASLVSRTPIRAVYSPTHRISVARPDDHRAVVGFEAGQANLDRDFDLYYAVQDRDVGLSLLTHRAAGDDGYFLAMIAPRTELTEREIARKEVIFVFDTSGSMAGDKIERAKAALDYMLRRLSQEDHFQVLRFSTDVQALFDEGRSVPATAANVRRARDFGRRFVAAGGTAIEGALTETFRVEAPEDRPARIVVFLTDGMPTIGETDPGRLVRSLEGRGGDARLFAFGVGDDVNTTFLDALAAQHGGVGDYFRDGAELERRMSAFYDRVAHPVLTDLQLLLPGLGAYDVYPRDLGHLYKGQQLLVVGRYRQHGRARLELRGRPSNRRTAHSFRFQVDAPRQHGQNDFLPRLWATRKIGHLLDAIRMGGERRELREEVVSLARRFGIVTPYTSYLVVDDEAVPAAVRRAPVARPPGARPEVESVLSPRGRARPVAGPEAPPLPSPEPAEEAMTQAFGGARTTYDFSDDEVEGDLVRPDGEMLNVRRRRRTGPTAATPRPRRDPTPTAAMPVARDGYGSRGRTVSRELRRMREAERSADGRTARVRYVSGQAYRRVGAAWVDTRYRRTLRSVVVRWGSDAYFSLVRARPRLRQALALGRDVTVVVDGTKAVIVTSNTEEGVSAARLSRFLNDT